MLCPRFCVLLASLAVGMLVVSCRNENAKEVQDVFAPPVEAVQAREGALPLRERMSGSVLADNQVELFPEIEGRIAKVLVENGDVVRAGQPLVELRPDEWREQVRRAEAGYKIAEARLRQSQAELAELEAQARRTRELGERALVTELELETTAAQVASAEADVDLARAELEQAAAVLAEQRDRLAKTTIRAPIDGVVGARDAEVGMQVTTSTPLFMIGNLERVKVRVNVTDVMLRRLAVGQPARILVPGAEGETQELMARVTRISPFLSEASRSTEAEIELDNPGRTLRPGMFVPVDVFYGESERATLVPTSALFTDPNTGRTGIFVVSGEMPRSLDAPPARPAEGTAAAQEFGETDAESTLNLSEPRPVTFASARVLARGDTAVAVDGLPAGAWVVTLGQDLLATQDGQARIRAVDWDHVMALQGMKREDLLQQVLRATRREAAKDDAR